MNVDQGLLPICMIVLAVFFVLRAFYTACEHALIEVNDGKVKSLAESDEKYQKLFEMISKPQKTRIAFSSNRAISAIVISGLAVVSFGEMLVDFLSRFVDSGWSVLSTKSSSLKQGSFFCNSCVFTWNRTCNIYRCASKKNS